MAVQGNITGTRIKLLLTDEEFQFPALNEMLNKFKTWKEISREGAGGRKTRAANKKADHLYEEIMAFKVPPIVVNHELWPSESANKQSNLNLADSSAENSDSDYSSMRPQTRSLRSRSRTPTAPTPQRQPRQVSTPSTPTGQKIRPYMKKAQSGGANTGTSVLSAALEQKHPSVELNRIRQLLKPDSVQKKREEKYEEEKERNHRLMSARKDKEQRAEAQKKKILEERAIAAKEKREQRLQHAAELRKAREGQKAQNKLRELEAKKAQLASPPSKINLKQQPQQPPQQSTQQTQRKTSQQPQTNHQSTKPRQNDEREQKLDAGNETYIANKESKPQEPDKINPNATFKKVEDSKSIEISIAESVPSQDGTPKKVKTVAAWTQGHQFREPLRQQFEKPDEEIEREYRKIFPAVALPVSLESIFGRTQAVHSNYLSRTSSAVWSPPNRGLKRTSSMLTPSRQDY